MPWPLLDRRAAAAAFLFVLCVALAGVSPAQISEGPVTPVAVVDFTASRDTPYRLSVPEFVVDEPVNSGAFDVLERDKLSTVVGEIGVHLTGLVMRAMNLLRMETHMRFVARNPVRRNGGIGQSRPVHNTGSILMKNVMLAMVALVAMSFGGAASAQGDLTRTIPGQMPQQGGECKELKDGKSVESGYVSCDLMSYFGIIMSSGECEPLSAVRDDKGAGNVHRHCWTKPA